MKNVLLFSLLTLSLTSFAQPKFTLETSKKFGEDFNANPAEYIAKNTTKDYQFISSSGVRYSKDQLVSNLKNLYTSMKIETQNEKIQQIGNVAIVSGDYTQKDEVKQVPSVLNMSMGSYNYIHHYDGKTWKLASSHHTSTYPDIITDDAAIRKVINDETKAFLDGDGKKLLSCWSKKKTNERGGQNLVSGLGQPYAKAGSMEKLQNYLANVKKQDKRAEQNDFEVRLNKNMAWATFTQKMIANDGTVATTNRETRILERINGDWKIVYLGQQAMK